MTKADDRREFHELLKKRGPNTSKRVITQTEWDRFEHLGYDMSKFITLQNLRKEQRERDKQEFIELRKQMDGNQQG